MTYRFVHKMSSKTIIFLVLCVATITQARYVEKRSASTDPANPACTCINPFSNTIQSYIGEKNLTCLHNSYCYVDCDSTCGDVEPATGWTAREGRCISKSACQTKKTIKTIGTIISHLYEEGSQFFTEDTSDGFDHSKPEEEGSGEDMNAMTEVEESGDERLVAVVDMAMLDYEMVAVVEEVENVYNRKEKVFENAYMKDLEVN